MDAALSAVLVLGAAGVVALAGGWVLSKLGL